MVFMKKIIISILIICLVGGISLMILNNVNKTSSSDKNAENNTENNNQTSQVENKDEKINDTTDIKNNLVSYNGWLKIESNTLVNEKNEKIQLKGMSTHGIQWYGNFANEEMIKKLRDEWGSNLFRIAMYTNENGYIQNKNIENDVTNVVDIAIKLDMYVIIDWHILSDNNPQTYKEEAKDFFKRMSEKYKDYPNVIYEICNEPNGNVTWNEDIKPYAEEVIKVIRENSKDSIIIVGTPTWSQDVDKAKENPINDKNVMYALHFYAGTHTEYLREKAKSALTSIPIFVSEWGVSDASGNGGVYLEEAQKWIDFMKENNISWANWSLSDKNESSALLKSGSPNNSLDDNCLSESGKFIKRVMLESK